MTILLHFPGHKQSITKKAFDQRSWKPRSKFIVYHVLQWTFCPIGLSHQPRFQIQALWWKLSSTNIIKINLTLEFTSFPVAFNSCSTSERFQRTELSNHSPNRNSNRRNFWRAQERLIDRQTVVRKIIHPWRPQNMTIWRPSRDLSDDSFGVRQKSPHLH